MTDKEKKKEFLDCYIANYGILSEALKQSGVKAKDFNRFMEAPEFRTEVQAVEMLRDDLITGQFIDLVKSGDSRAIIEARKLQKEKSAGLDLGEIRRKSMIYFINNADTKSKALAEYCDWFGVADSTAETFYKKMVVENKLVTPLERKKKKAQEHEKRLDTRLKNRDLDEIGMIENLLIIQAGIVEDAEYPSEKSRATQEILNLTRRLDEMKAEAEKKKAISGEDLCYLLDSELMGISVDKVKELEKTFNGNLIEMI